MVTSLSFDINLNKIPVICTSILETAYIPISKIWLQTTRLIGKSFQCMKLNWLTNSDSNLQSKMRYFADYFLVTNDYLGRLPKLPFDNPLSLVNKIIFQIENNF